MLQTSIKTKDFFLRYYKYIFYILAFFVPFPVYLSTMNPSSPGWDTTWLHIQVPGLYVGQTTGFPLAFLLGKLFSFLPVSTMAFRLNLFSVFWGSATVFIMFIFANNLLAKEYYIAFISAIFFGFFRVFWLQTNRFEVYTLNTFFMAAIILAGYYWYLKKTDKSLYLFYFLIGLSFTNHPISLFLAPAFIAFPFYTDAWRAFKLKKIFIIISMILSPNLLYLYIPIRSWQGFGNVRTLSEFIYYISGDRYKSQFGFKSFDVLKKIFLEYLNMLKGDLTIIVFLIFLGGLVFLAMYRRKFFYLILSLIILNLIPVLLYEQEATHFYFATMIVFLCPPFACGLYWIREAMVIFYNRFLKKPLAERAGIDRGSRKFLALKAFLLLIFFILITFFPVNLFASNYKKMDMSNDTYVYDYWKSFLTEINPGSVIISNSLTFHVPIYIDTFETKKDIKVLRDLDLNEIRELVKENIGRRDLYYTDAYLPDLTRYFDVEITDGRFHIKDYESFLIYKIKGINIDTLITTGQTDIQMEFGKTRQVSFYIKNISNKDLNISSVEMELPDMLQFSGMDTGSSDMPTPPGLSRGIYMWTAGPYTVPSQQEYIISFSVLANTKGNGTIKFRITTANIYIEGPEINVTVK